MGTSWAIATLVAYPCYFAREMVDIWPKERGGHCTWQNNYRVAVSWIFQNTDILFTNFFGNYATWMLRRGVPVFLAFWIADNLGMFSNVADATIGIENVFPNFLESA